MQIDKYAPVVPIGMANELRRLGLLGNYHLLLPHDVLKYPRTYAKVYGGIRRMGGIVILDNSVFELKVSLPDGEMISAASFVNPNYIVLPEVWGDHQATLKMAEESVKVWGESQVLRTVDIACVPQGGNLDEIHQCLDDLMDLHPCKLIGVPKYLTEDICGTRLHTIDYIQTNWPDVKMHLLGFSRNLADDIRCIKQANVIGIDSAAPFHLGAKGIELHEGLRDYPKRGDWWETTGDYPSELQLKNLEWSRNVLR